MESQQLIKYITKYLELLLRLIECISVTLNESWTVQKI